VRQPGAGITQEESRRFSRFIALATAGAVAYSVALPLIRVYSIAADPPELGHANYALVALAIYLPIQLWLVVSATRREQGRGQLLALSVMASVMFGAMPAVGVGWVGIIDVLAALALVTLGRPWSILVFCLLVAAPTPLTFAYGHPEWALFFTIGVPFYSVPLAVAIWLIRVARQLQWARQALADQAIARERLRIDWDLRGTIGTALEGIAADGDRAIALATNDSVDAATQVRALVTSARRTLAVARRMSSRYREVSLRAELETAATLLLAAGIDIQVQMLPESLPDVVDEGERARLRREIARVIGDARPTSVTITVTRDEGGLRLSLVSETRQHTTEVSAS